MLIFTHQTCLGYKRDLTKFVVRRKIVRFAQAIPLGLALKQSEGSKHWVRALLKALLSSWNHSHFINPALSVGPAGPHDQKFIGMCVKPSCIKFKVRKGAGSASVAFIITLHYMKSNKSPLLVKIPPSLCEARFALAKERHFRPRDVWNSSFLFQQVQGACFRLGSPTSQDKRSVTEWHNSVTPAAYSQHIRLPHQGGRRW